MTACGGVREVYCDMTTDGGGWTIIDPHHDPGWKGCFQEWRVSGVMAGSASSCSSWRAWFLGAPEGADFRVSPGCAEVTSAKTSQVYRWTGNYYGCTWYNRNCDVDRGECRRCADAHNGQTLTGGTCPNMVHGADSTYCHDCRGDWWNHAPSIGIDGKSCVGYR